MLGNNKNFNTFPKRGFSTLCCKTSVHKLVTLIVECLNNWIVALITVLLWFTLPAVVYFKVVWLPSTGPLPWLVALKFHIILTCLSESNSRTPITYLPLNWLFGLLWTNTKLIMNYNQNNLRKGVIFNKLVSTCNLNQSSQWNAITGPCNYLMFVIYLIFPYSNFTICHCSKVNLDLHCMVNLQQVG